MYGLYKGFTFSYNEEIATDSSLLKWPSDLDAMTVSCGSEFPSSFVFSLAYSKSISMEDQSLAS